MKHPVEMAHEGNGIVGHQLHRGKTYGGKTGTTTMRQGVANAKQSRGQECTACKGTGEYPGFCEGASSANLGEKSSLSYRVRGGRIRETKFKRGSTETSAAKQKEERREGLPAKENGLKHLQPRTDKPSALVSRKRWGRREQLD